MTARKTRGGDGVPEAEGASLLMQIDSDDRIGLQVADVSPFRFFYRGKKPTSPRTLKGVLATYASDVA